MHPSNYMAVKGCGIILLALAIAFGSVVWWNTVREPGAAAEAKVFGHQMRQAISDEEMMAWAKELIANTPPEPHFTIVPPEKWHPKFSRVSSASRPVCAVGIQWDDLQQPTGIVIDNRSVGVVIPWRGVIPDTNYFSVHWLGERCPYLAFSYYR